MLVIEPAAFVMTRKVLLGIEQRAESLALHELILHLAASSERTPTAARLM